MTQNATQAKKSMSFTVGVSFRLSSYYSVYKSCKAKTIHVDFYFIFLNEILKSGSLCAMSSASRKSKKLNFSHERHKKIV